MKTTLKGATVLANRNEGYYKGTVATAVNRPSLLRQVQHQVGLASTPGKVKIPRTSLRFIC